MYECKCNRLRKGVENGFGGRIGKSRTQVPNDAKDLAHFSMIDAIYATIYQVEHTMSLKESGAFKASAISWALALTLPFLVRIVRIASLRLGCL